MEINKSIGGTLIIAGTAIGAGMLVLPIIISPLGFWLSMLLLCVMWACMAYASVIALEVFSKFPSNYSVASIAREVFGHSVEIIALTAILLLFYSLSAAYISALSEIIATYIHSIFKRNITHIGISSAVTLTFAWIIYSSVYITDLSNRLLMILKVVFFIIIIVMLSPHSSSGHLFYGHASEGLLLPVLAMALPVVFTSFGFHGSIPSIIAYMKRDFGKIKKALLIGSFIPLLVFLIWVISIMSVMPDLNFMGKGSGDLGTFIRVLSKISNSKIMPYMISGFSFMAISTSFLGVALALFDFMIERFHYNKNNKSDRMRAVLVVFAFPFLVNVMKPQLFVAALGFAAIALSIIAVFIPVGCAIKMNETKQPKILLWLMIVFGMAIVITELYNLALI